MAGLAVADKKADDERFAALLEPLADGADDDRPLVRKGASWALRSIGKRSHGSTQRPIETAVASCASPTPVGPGGSARTPCASCAARRCSGGYGTLEGACPRTHASGSWSSGVMPCACSAS